MPSDGSPASSPRHFGPQARSGSPRRSNTEAPSSPSRPPAQVYEAFGRIDGPVAWNIWNGSLGFCAALLSEEGASTIWEQPDPIIANSARPAGVATPVPGGYRLSGRWDIVSAIDIADWVGLFAIVAGSTPEVRVLALPRGDFTILDTWHTTGMRGTGSKTVLVDDALVPAHLTVSPFAGSRIDRPLFRIPPFTIASTGAAPIVLGMAQAAIDEIVAIAPTKGTDNGQPPAAPGPTHRRASVRHRPRSMPHARC